MARDKNNSAVNSTNSMDINNPNIIAYLAAPGSDQPSSWAEVAAIFEQENGVAVKPGTIKARLAPPRKKALEAKEKYQKTQEGSNTARKSKGKRSATALENPKAKQSKTNEVDAEQAKQQEEVA